MHGSLQRLLCSLLPRQLLYLRESAPPGLHMTRMAWISLKLQVDKIGNVHQPENAIATNLE